MKPKHRAHLNLPHRNCTTHGALLTVMNRWPRLPVWRCILIYVCVIGAYVDTVAANWIKRNGWTLKNPETRLSLINEWRFGSSRALNWKYMLKKCWKGIKGMNYPLYNCNTDTICSHTPRRNEALSVWSFLESGITPYSRKILSQFHTSGYYRLYIYIYIYTVRI